MFVLLKEKGMPKALTVFLIVVCILGILVTSVLLALNLQSPPPPLPPAPHHTKGQKVPSAGDSYYGSSDIFGPLKVTLDIKIKESTPTKEGAKGTMHMSVDVNVAHGKKSGIVNWALDGNNRVRLTETKSFDVFDYINKDDYQLYYYPEQDKFTIRCGVNTKSLPDIVRGAVSNLLVVRADITRK